MEALILQMLEKDPRLRPSAAEAEPVLSKLARESTGIETGPAMLRTRRHTVGREKELVKLRAGFESAVAGGGLILCVSGEPGIGKTTLVEDFLNELTAGGRHCTIARGRSRRDLRLVH